MTVLKQILSVAGKILVYFMSSKFELVNHHLDRNEENFFEFLFALT